MKKKQGNKISQAHPLAHIRRSQRGNHIHHWAWVSETVLVAGVSQSRQRGSCELDLRQEKRQQAECKVCRYLDHEQGWGHPEVKSRELSVRSSVQNLNSSWEGNKGGMWESVVRFKLSDTVWRVSTGTLVSPGEASVSQASVSELIGGQWKIPEEAKLKVENRYGNYNYKVSIKKKWRKKWVEKREERTIEMK